MELDLPSLPPRSSRPARAPAPRRPATSADHDLPLARGATLALRLAHGSRIAVQAGRVWLTESGDPDDHFVVAGTEHRVRRTGRVVIEGDSVATAHVRIIAA